VATRINVRLKRTLRHEDLDMTDLEEGVPIGIISRMIPPEKGRRE